MISQVKSIALRGLEGVSISVQADISAGIPSWEIVGLPDVSIKESKERIKAAIRNSGYEFLSRKIIINLAPATIRKGGSSFDLPIAIAILMADKVIKKQDLVTTIFIGELLLDGKINKVTGVLPMCIEASKLGMKCAIVPKKNAKEAAIVKELKIIPVENLKQVIEYLNGLWKIEEQKIDITSILKRQNSDALDFSEVNGQENIKRALEVAASGGHNCMMIGSPGSGKTMMAKRINTILPDLSFEEALEITKIHSIAGNLQNDTPLIGSRPFRSPHHTITPSAMVGGGRNPTPGEISLSHYGVLFLDELPEFNKNVLEILRGPLEDGKITISRVNASLTYPCAFMLVASLNPCPCGYYGSERKCTCTPEMIKRYISKISGPLLDRIDIQIRVSSLKYDKLNCINAEETSASIRQRVNMAREIQKERYKEYGIFSNSELTPRLMEKFCKLTPKGNKIIESAFNKLELSARAYNRILKVARTIADLDDSQNIECNHLLEAIQYRALDRK